MAWNTIHFNYFNNLIFGLPNDNVFLNEGKSVIESKTEISTGAQMQAFIDVVYSHSYT